jgi:hypothetical protein
MYDMVGFLPTLTKHLLVNDVRSPNLDPIPLVVIKTLYISYLF